MRAHLAEFQQDLRGRRIVDGRGWRGHGTFLKIVFRLLMGGAPVTDAHPHLTVTGMVAVVSIVATTEVESASPTVLLIAAGGMVPTALAGWVSWRNRSPNTPPLAPVAENTKWVYPV